MQSPPAYEGMYLHGILHRIEGDYDNARAWYSDVRGSEVYIGMWGSHGVGWKEWNETSGEKDEGQRFLDEVQKFKQGKNGHRRAVLEEASRKELEHVITFCEEKFGTDKWEDASDAWVQHSEQVRQMGEDQVSGNSGQRNF